MLIVKPTLVPTEEEIMEVIGFAWVAGATTVLRTTTTLFLLGQHFICNMKEEIKDQKTKKHMSLKIHMFLFLH